MASVVVNGDTSGAVTLSAPAVAGTVTVTLPSTSGTMLTTASTTGISGSAISSGTVPEAYGGTGTSTGYYGFKNRIINGAMVIDQRNAGASVATTTTATPVYALDRWAYQCSAASKFTVQQNAASITPPTGFKTYLGVTSTSAYSVLTGDYFLLRQPIEGFNTADLGFGTASASTVTLSFWVRSSLTGTFGGSLENGASDRSYPFSYTILAANTWEQKSVTVAGDTSGTWVGATNGTGLIVFFGLGVGSTYSGTAGAWAAGNFLAPTGATSVVGTNGATFYITGVQLEKGSTATSFDYRPYGTELALCQRYYQQWGGETAYTRICLAQARSTTAADIILPLMIPMRTAPTFSSSGTVALSNSSSGFLTITSYTTDASTTQVLQFLGNVASGLVAGNATQFATNNDTAARFKVTAEL